MSQLLKYTEKEKEDEEKEVEEEEKEEEEREEDEGEGYYIINHSSPSDGQDTEEDYDSEVPEDDIDVLLEKGLLEEMKGPRKMRRAAPYDEKQKIVLVGLFVSLCVNI